MEELENKLPTLKEVIAYVNGKDKSISDAIISKAYDVIEKMNRPYRFDFKEGVYEHSKVLRLM